MFVKKYVVLFINLFLLLLISSESLATAWPKTRAEFASLPPYCLARQGKQIGLTVSEVEIKKWERILGGGFLHVHHFCAALNTLKILDRGTPKEYELQGVIKEFDYVLTQSPKNFPLIPLINVEKGKVLLRLNQRGEAVREFLNAIKFKPNYTLPYAVLSDYYVQYGQEEEAKSILEEGLKHSPKSKMLMRRLAKLK
ncbi:MAG: hypothetical protein H6964_01945 [Chromatiaceae bacterium]|nr:hypothetical protein [Gammaproteobacteria bacterium]MCP5445743.1 hypothetical protein [Chromatiaceae bacterium]